MVKSSYDEVSHSYYPKCNVSALTGKTLTRVDNDDNCSLTFICEDGTEYSMFHGQNCCEVVYIEDICGDLNDLVGSPILLAEEVSNYEPPEEVTSPYKNDCELWTFYKLATNKGSVTLRWFGSSNGYYSVSVDFRKTK